MRTAFIGLMLAAGSAFGHAQPGSAPAKPARAEAYVVTVRALDTAQAGRELHDQLVKAGEAKAPALVLVLSPSMPWRADVVRDVLLDLKGSPIETAVYVERGEEKLHGRAGWGALVLGLGARRWGAGDVLAAEVRRDDEDRLLAPEKTDWNAVEADLRELLAPRVAARGWVDGAVDVLLWPREVWWSSSPAKGAEGAYVLSKGAEPAKAEGRSVVKLNREAEGGVPQGFQASLRLLTGADGAGPRVAASWDAFCKAEKIKPPAHPSEATGMPLVDVRIGVEQALEQDAQVRGQSEKAIEAAEAKKTPDAEAARVGSRELIRLQGAVAAQLAVEKMFERYPELLRTVPPGKVAVGAKPASNGARWRSLLQSRRDAVEKLKGRAQKLKDRQP